MLSLVVGSFIVFAWLFILMPALAVTLAVVGMLFRYVRGDHLEHPMHLATREFYPDDVADVPRYGEEVN